MRFQKCSASLDYELLPRSLSSLYNNLALDIEREKIGQVQCQVVSAHVVRTTSKSWEGRELLKFTKMKNALAKRAICYFSLRNMEISDVLVTSLAA